MMALLFVLVFVIGMLCPPSLRAAVMRDETSPEAIATHLPVYVWDDPAVEIKGVVMAVHGTTQDGRSFDSMARRLVPSGYLVVAMDLRGHGQWFLKTRFKQPGHACDYRGSVGDLLSVMKAIHKNHPLLPIFCIGESVGSAVAVHAAGIQPGLFDGLILVSAGSRPRLYDPLMVIPDFMRGIRKLDRPLDATRYIERYASEDARVTSEMVRDPLSRTSLSGKEILRTAGFISTLPQAASRLSSNIPILVFQGADDHIVDGSTARKMFEELSAEDKTFVTVPQCGHVILGTAYIKPKVMTTLSRWLTDQTEAYSRQRLAAPKLDNSKHFASQLPDILKAAQPALLEASSH